MEQLIVTAMMMVMVMVVLMLMSMMTLPSLFPFFHTPATSPPSASLTRPFPCHLQVQNKFKMFKDVEGCSKIHKNVQKDSMKFKDPQRSPKMFKDVQRSTTPALRIKTAFPGLNWPALPRLPLQPVVRVCAFNIASSNL